MTAIEELRTRLTETLECLASGQATGNCLKDHHYTLAKSFRTAIEELRKTEMPQPHWTDKQDYSGVG
jgi:hypothetical protein